MMAKTRETMIKEIEARYGRPWGAQGASVRLETMDLDKLRSLHGSLLSLFEREDMRRKPTEASQAKRAAARKRFTSAVGRLRALRQKSDEVLASREVAKAQGTITIRSRLGHFADLDALSSSGMAESNPVTEEVVELMAEDFRENVIYQLQESSPESDQILDHLVELAMNEDLYEMARSHYESSRLIFAQAVQLRLYREAIGSDGDRRHADVLNRLVHETYLRQEQQPLVLTAPDRFLPAFQVPEILRKLTAFVASFKPDLLYAPNPGSRAVAEFLSSECKSLWQIDTPIWGRRQTMPSLSRHPIMPRILFISDVAEDVGDYNRFRKRMTRDLGAHVGFAALVSFADVRASLYDTANTCIAALTFEKGYNLPWSREGRYRRDESGHVFGADTSNTLVIPEAFIEWPEDLHDLGERETADLD